MLISDMIRGIGEKFMKQLFFVFLISEFLFSRVTIFGNDIQRWTALYGKQIKWVQAQKNAIRSELAFAKGEVVPFTQLIFSWNVVRPMKGYFSFWACVRDAQSKKWYAWHRMSDWGFGRQKSYLSQAKDGTNFYHVRLELPKEKKADAFRIKVKAHGGASLALVRGLYVALADMTNFESEKNNKNLLQLPSVYIQGIPRYSQMTIDHERADGMCSPTSCSMLVNYVCKNHLVDPRSFALRVHDKGLDAFGSWPFNTAHAFEQCDGTVHFFVQRLPSFETLHGFLIKGLPVIVSVRGVLQGGFKDYENGHLMVVVGWDAQKQQVLCHDPAFSAVNQIFIRYHLIDFLTAWERSRRLSYVAQRVSLL